jgi:hypothetical protein
MDILKVLADNPTLFEAVKGLLLAKCDLNHIKANTPNAELGEITRALLTAREMIEEAFTEIATYKTVKDNPEKPNPAR